MKYTKGFTLIELLVAITIIGIIIIMTLPAIKNLQRENQKKKFDDYERAVLEAAKVYEDQYEEDLFGRSGSGCAYIDYSDLVEKKLLTTTKISGYECNNTDNGIIIRKVKGKSYYEVYLTCSKGETDTKDLTENTNYTSIKNTQCAPGEDYTPPTLTIKCDNDKTIGVEGDEFTGIYYYSATNEGTKKLPKLTAQISEENSGLEKNQYVTYEWKLFTTKTDENPFFTEKNKTTFNIKDGVGSTSTKNIRITDQFKQANTTGKAIVDVIGENIIDRAGNKLDATLDEAKETCTYYYDNVKPEMTITITGNNTGRNYNTSSDNWINEPITTTVTVTDKTNNNIYSGIDMTKFTRNGGNETLSAKDETTATHTYTLVDANRSSDDVYRVCDKVGNCIEQTVKIRVDTTKPTCKSRDGDPNWRSTNLTINGDCEDNLSGCKKNPYSKTYSDDQSITNGTAGQACDKAENCITCTEDQDVHIDKTPPICTIEISNENVAGEQVSLNGICSETKGEIKQTKWLIKFDNGPGFDQSNGNAFVYPNPYAYLTKASHKGTYTFVCTNKADLTCTIQKRVNESRCRIYKTYSTGNTCSSQLCNCASCSKGSVILKDQWTSTNLCHQKWNCEGYEYVTSGEYCGYNVV